MAEEEVKEKMERAKEVREEDWERVGRLMGVGVKEYE